MGHNKRILSSSFNMSIGFIPVIVTLILAEISEIWQALSVGMLTGMILCAIPFFRRKAYVPNFILLISLFLLFLISISYAIGYTPHFLSFTEYIEAWFALGMLLLYLFRHRFVHHYELQKNNCSRRLFAQGAESAIVSARILLLMVGLHAIIYSLCTIGESPIDKGLHHLPLIVFLLVVFFNQVALHYFNSLMEHTEYIPIVNTQGDVIGKSLAIQALNYKNEFINPVIRIAVVCNGMLYLCKRTPPAILDRWKTDVPLECFLRYGEAVEDAAKRLVCGAFPKQCERMHLHFALRYHFENNVANRLIYLYLLEVNDEELVNKTRFRTEGKLWLQSQIEDNIGKNFLGSCLEEEWETIKNIIYIREIYKES